MIILVGTEKGGVGKSTIAVNLAVHLVHHNIDVVVVDADPQATCALFVARRDEAALKPSVNCVQRTGNIAPALTDLASRYQVVIVDAGGRDSLELRTAASVANLMILPTRASQADLETLPKMNDIIRMAKSYNPALQAVAVLSMAPTNPTIREVSEAREFLASLDQISSYGSIISDRKVYRDALNLGKGVVEMDNPLARAEIQLLAQEYFDLEA